jgi:regulator of sirC expression with transglutaminase-like and TPR domain
MDLDATLGLLAHTPDAPVDVAELALQLARDEYPDLDVEAYLAELEAMAREASHYARGDFPARVAGLSRYLFHEMGFHGNRREYYDPRNSYLNDVLDRRTGIPITLSLVAMAVGARIGLRIVGVGLPGHFVAKALDCHGEIVFDPFHGGRSIGAADCEALVRQATGTPCEMSPELLRPFPTAGLTARMLNNLQAIYAKGNDFVRVARVIGRLRQLDPSNLDHARDLGLALVRAGRPGRAVTELHSYLKARPEAFDAAMVRQGLSRAWSEIARWN